MLTHSSSSVSLNNSNCLQNTRLKRLFYTCVELLHPLQYHSYTLSILIQLSFIKENVCSSWFSLGGGWRFTVDTAIKFLLWGVDHQWRLCAPPFVSCWLDLLRLCQSSLSPLSRRLPRHRAVLLTPWIAEPASVMQIRPGYRGDRRQRAIQSWVKTTLTTTPPSPVWPEPSPSHHFSLPYAAGSVSGFMPEWAWTSSTSGAFKSSAIPTIR